ncbi:hypothetical protein L6164_034744 [Bauhinia variegata]|uniref:Uncharacterized protein n=1 Tax=Bauhinia variegata TaxID=167791 RepID=A0ACB9KVN9_BAUVA|nr:hypothetical protein L6164_034744 [Bauhinia variegata]
MKRQLSSSDEEDYESSRMASFCWWRSDAKFDECVKLKLDLPNVSSLTLRLRLLRELERLALVAAEGLNELRHKLLLYRSGDFWVPAGGISKEQMDIPQVITVLLVGFTSSGKSSLVNLMYSVLGRSGLIPFAQTSSGNCSNFTTMFLEEHNVLRSTRSGFCVYDSRGFDYNKMDESLEELSNWMNNGVHHKQLCRRAGDYLQTKEELETLALKSSTKFVTRRVNCAMVVVDIAKTYKALKAGDSKLLEATKNLFCSSALRKCNENPLLILTHGDMLSTEERIEGRLKLCECLGISETTGVYDIVCLTEYGFLVEESDPISAYALTEAVYRALLISDRGHLPRKTILDWVTLVLAWLFCFIGAFFACLADICSRLASGNKLKL